MKNGGLTTVQMNAFNVNAKLIGMSCWQPKTSSGGFFISHKSHNKKTSWFGFCRWSFYLSHWAELNVKWNKSYKHSSKTPVTQCRRLFSIENYIIGCPQILVSNIENWCISFKFEATKFWKVFILLIIESFFSP